jgi:hypothetical protein
VLRNTPEDIIEQRDLYDRRPSVLKSWSKNGVTMIGDAVHPMMPNLGQVRGRLFLLAGVFGVCGRSQLLSTFCPRYGQDKATDCLAIMMQLLYYRFTIALLSSCIHFAFGVISLRIRFAFALHSLRIRVAFAFLSPCNRLTISPPLAPHPQGGCQAIEDAYVLTEALCDITDKSEIPDALQSYYQQRIVRSAVVQGMSRFSRYGM